MKKNHYTAKWDYSHKLRCLAQIIVNGNKKYIKFKDDACYHYEMVQEDIIVCANLIRQRLDNLHSGFDRNEHEWDAEQIHDTLVFLNTILAVMEENMLRGLPAKDFRAFKKTLESFLGSIDERGLSFFKKQLKSTSKTSKTFIEYVTEATSVNE